MVRLVIYFFNIRFSCHAEDMKTCKTELEASRSVLVILFCIPAAGTSQRMTCMATKGVVQQQAVGIQMSGKHDHW